VFSYLEHGEQEVLFTAFVLVSVDGEHDGLQQRINLGHGNQTTEVGNMPRLGLQQEQQVAVLLRLVVVGENAFLHLGGIFKMACDFVLLEYQKSAKTKARTPKDKLGDIPPPEPCDSV
jgi:hypothetical protein